MKITLVNSNLMRPPVVPIALDYIASALRAKGHSADLLDLCKADDWKKACDKYFSGSNPDAIGVTIRNTDDCFMAGSDFKLPAVKEITGYIKRKSGAPIILGGCGFSVFPERIMDFLDVNLGIVGEGESALPLLLHVISRPSEYRKVPGLVRKIGGTYRRNPPVVLDLENTKLSDRSTVDNLWYFNNGGMGAVETKRGCVKSCIYCADRISKGKQCRRRDPKDIADEFANLLKQGVTYIHICDHEFNLPYGHAVMVCQELIDRNLGEKIRWYTYACPGHFDKSLAVLMKKAGCAGINFGIDSGDPAMLRWLGKDHTVKDIAKTARLCRNNKIPFMFDLLIGGMGETKKSVKNTIDLMMRAGPDCVGVSMGIRVYPGTEIADMVKTGLYSKKLKGRVKNNPGFFEPVFYLEEDFTEYILELIAGDNRFFFPQKEKKSYNYSGNNTLIAAIKKGARGAFWDILRRQQPMGHSEIEI